MPWRSDERWPQSAGGSRQSGSGLCCKAWEQGTHALPVQPRSGRQAGRRIHQVLHKRRLSYTNQVCAVRQLVHSKVSTRPFVPLGCYVLEHAPALGLPLLLPATCNRCWRRRTIALATLFLYLSVPACAIAGCWKSRRSSTDGRPPSWGLPARTCYTRHRPRPSERLSPCT